MKVLMVSLMIATSALYGTACVAMEVLDITEDSLDVFTSARKVLSPKGGMATSKARANRMEAWGEVQSAALPSPERQSSVFSNVGKQALEACFSVKSVASLDTPVVAVGSRRRPGTPCPAAYNSLGAAARRPAPLLIIQEG